ncbi:MAG: carbohydrate kinase family protein [Candidatus Shapirobacteria bacterium]|jgi:ribokinase
MTPFIVTLGAATIDFFVKSTDFEISHNSLILPYSAKTEAQSAAIVLGGGATNSAVSFSRLGINSICLSPYPNNSFAEFVKSTLRSEKVNINHLYPSSEADFSVILVAPDGGRTVVTWRGNQTPTATKIPWSKLIGASWFYITSLEGNFSLLEKVIGFCRENKIKIALNPGHRELAMRQNLLPLLPYVDFLLVNRTESETLTNLSFSNPKFFSSLLSLKVPIIALTNGRLGAHILTSESTLFSPIKNIKPVDETGAGDAFGSTFVAALNFHLPLNEALSWAITNSASVVSYLGAKAGLLTLSELNQSLKSHVGKTSKK